MEDKRLSDYMAPIYTGKQNAMKDALQVKEEYLNDIHDDAMGNCTFDCVQMSLLHLY